MDNFTKDEIDTAREFLATLEQIDVNNGGAVEIYGEHAARMSTFLSKVFHVFALSAFEHETIQKGNGEANERQ